MVESRHQDVVSLIGEVRAADLNGGSFTLRLEDGTDIPCRFTPPQEAAIIEALRSHKNARLHIKGKAELTGPNGKVRRILLVEELSLRNEQGGMPDPAARPIWQVFDGIMGDLPENELSKLPVDAAEEHDHYIYGTPKRNA